MIADREERDAERARGGAPCAGRVLLGMRDNAMSAGNGSVRVRARWLSPVGLLVFGLAFVGGTGLAEAKGARLHVSLPASVADGATWNIRATGYAGKYDTLGFHAFPGHGCTNTEAAFEDQGPSGGGFVSVTPNQAFDVSVGLIARNPGRHQVCVYLFKHVAPHGRQLHEDVRYQVVAE